MKARDLCIASLMRPLRRTCETGIGAMKANEWKAWLQVEPERIWIFGAYLKII